MENLFSSYFLPVTLAIITLGMGLSITIGDFRNVFIKPKAFIIGLCCQMLLLPLIAFGLDMITDLNPYLKVGLVIIAACPGGATSNLISYLLRGNVALSISLTASSSLITLFSIPFNVSLALGLFLKQDAEIHLNVVETVVNLLLLTIVPAFLGVFIRHRFSNLAESLNKPLRYILPLILLLVFLGVMFIDEGSEKVSQRDFIQLLPMALLLNVISMFFGWQISRLSRLTIRNQFTVVIEVGLQNSALAIYVASNLLNNKEMAIVAVVYGSFTFFSTALFAWGVKRISKPSKMI